MFTLAGRLIIRRAPEPRVCRTAGTRAEGRTTHPLRALLHTCIHRSLSRPCDGNAREAGQCLTCSLAWRTDRRDAFLGDAAFGVDGSSHGRRGCVQPCRTVGFRHRRCHCGGGGGRGHAALVPLNLRRWRRRGRATLSCSRVSLALTHRNATGPPCLCSPVSGGAAAGRARGLYACSIPWYPDTSIRPCACASGTLSHPRAPAHLVLEQNCAMCPRAEIRARPRRLSSRLVTTTYVSRRRRAGACNVQVSSIRRAAGARGA